ncbi:thioredoxin-like protein [Catenaria anguillulae PL171]|uniref:Thioredoxin-like protein n=1 Tax=Catenaria anguillulae PL171 TaxID=765915 RepID=A0A1Y2HZQ9_9FUNG|nr:thioredoxin-like protein [Catenaria anguillulae PL171]
MPPVTLLESMPDFQRAIAQNKLSVVDFFAVWCGPCKAISPRFEKMAQDNTNANFFKVNVDNLPDVAREYGVTAMPTFKLFKSGKLIDTIVGANVCIMPLRSSAAFTFSYTLA